MGVFCLICRVRQKGAKIIIAKCIKSGIMISPPFSPFLRRFRVILCVVSAMNMSHYSFFVSSYVLHSSLAHILNRNDGHQDESQWSKAAPLAADLLRGASPVCSST